MFREPAPERVLAEARHSGARLSFGDISGAAAIGVTNRDERCAMVSFDPDSARQNGEVLRTIVRVRDNKVGVYGTVVRRGHLAVGQSVVFEPTHLRG